MVDIEKALLDPPSVFKSADEVLALDINDQKKLEILQRWAYDEKELMIADEENMTGSDQNHLDDIVRAIENLQARMTK